MLHRPLLRLLGSTIGLIGLAGCASMVTGGLASGLSDAIQNQDDPATVEAGAPAYLLMIDGFIADSPDDTTMLMAGAKLYSAFATVFVEDPDRARRLADKARRYARRALCQRRPQVCADDRRSYQEFLVLLDRMTVYDLPALFTYGFAWAGWIQTNTDDWDAVADLARVEAIMARVVALDETFERGQGHLYLAVLRSLRPATLGGRPEEGRSHFERAIALSDGRNLMAKVEFARRYARLVFDKPLHDRLLREVIDADPNEPKLTLSNTLAQRQARALLKSSNDYF
jgi:hypothetical protein